MAQAFNINARLSLQGPYNVQPVVQSIRRQVEGIPTNLDFKLSPKSSQAIGGISQEVVATTEQLRGMTRIAGTLGDAIGKIKFGPDTNVGTAEFRKQVKAAMGDLKRLDDAISGVKSQSELAGEVFGATARRLGLFIVAAKAFQIVSSGLETATTKALAFQNEMVRLSQIGGTSSGAIAAVSTEISRLSTNLGTSSQDLSEVAVTLRQAGLSADETKTALEALAKTTLAPTFESLKNTTEGVIAMRQQFDVSSEDIAKRLGSINTVAGEFAVESEDLVTAIRKAGGAFKSASGDMVSSEQSFNQLLALFTSVRNTTRESADEIATGLRTIFARVQSTSVSNSLKEMGINLRFTREESKDFGRDVTGQFVGAYEAVRRLSAATQDLPTTDPRFSQIVEQLGGFRQISRVIPLLQQFGTAQKAYTVAQAGANSLTTDAAKAQDSFLVKLTKVKEEFFDLIRTLSGNKTFQTMVDYFLKGTSAALSLAKSLEPIVPLITTIAAVKIGSGILDAGRGAINKFSDFRGAASRNSRTERIDPEAIRRRGGGIIPGHGTGDKVPLLAEPGEFVLNRKASQSIGYAALHKWNGGEYNRRETPRFADGGQTKFPIITEPGEYYFDRQSVTKIGLSKLHQANRTGKIPRDVAEQLDPRERLASKINDIGGMRATLKGFNTGGQIKRTDRPDKSYPNATPLLQPLDPRERLALKLKAMGRLGDAWKDRPKFATGGVTQTPSTRVLDWDRIRKLRDLEQGVNGEAPMKVDGFSRLRRRFEMDPDTKQPTARAKYYATSRSARYAMGRGFDIPPHVKKLLGRATGGRTDISNQDKKKLLIEEFVAQNKGKDPNVMDLKSLLGDSYEDITQNAVGENLNLPPGGGDNHKATKAADAALLRILSEDATDKSDPLPRLVHSLNFADDPEDLKNYRKSLGLNEKIVAGGRMQNPNGQDLGVLIPHEFRKSGLEGTDFAARKYVLDRFVHLKGQLLEQNQDTEGGDADVGRHIDAMSKSVNIENSGPISNQTQQSRVDTASNLNSPGSFLSDAAKKELLRRYQNQEKLNALRTKQGRPTEDFTQNESHPYHPLNIESTLASQSPRKPAVAKQIASPTHASSTMSDFIKRRRQKPDASAVQTSETIQNVIGGESNQPTTRRDYHYGPNNPTIPEIPDHIKNPGTYPDPLNLSEDSPPVQVTRVAQEPESVTPSLNLKRVKSATPTVSSPVELQTVATGPQTVAAPNKTPKAKYAPNVSFTPEDLANVASKPTVKRFPIDTDAVEKLRVREQEDNEAAARLKARIEGNRGGSSRTTRIVASPGENQDSPVNTGGRGPRLPRKTASGGGNPPDDNTPPWIRKLIESINQLDKTINTSIKQNRVSPDEKPIKSTRPRRRIIYRNTDPKPLVPDDKLESIVNDWMKTDPYRLEPKSRRTSPLKKSKTPGDKSKALPGIPLDTEDTAADRMYDPSINTFSLSDQPLHPIPFATHNLGATRDDPRIRGPKDTYANQNAEPEIPFVGPPLARPTYKFRPDAIPFPDTYDEASESYQLQNTTKKRRSRKAIPLDESTETIPFADEPNPTSRRIVPPRPPKSPRRPIDSYSLNQPTLQPANADRTRKALQDFYEQTLKQRRGDLSADDIKKFAAEAVTRQEARGGMGAVDNSLKRFTSKSLRSQGKDGSREGSAFFNAYNQTINPDNNYQGSPDDVNGDLNQFYHAKINQSSRTRTPARAAKLQNYIVQRQADRGAQVLTRQDPYGVDIPYVDQPLTRFKSGGLLNRGLSAANRIAHTNIPVPFRSMVGADGVSPATRGERVGKFVNGGAATIYGTTIAASYIQDAYGNHDANDVDSLERSRKQTGASGAVTGAALGAQVGSMVPIPGGAAIGAVAGLIIGFGTSVANVDKQIKAIKLDKSLQGLARAIDDVVSGRVEAGAAAQAINKRVTGVREEVASQTAGTGGNFFNSFSNFLENWTPGPVGSSLNKLGNAATNIGLSATSGVASVFGVGFDHDSNTSVFGNSAQDRAKSQFTAQQSKEQELLGPLLPQLRQSMELLAGSIKLSDKDIQTTTGGDPEAKRTERASLLNQNGGRELIETISRVEKVPINQVVREFDATLLRTNNARVKTEKSRDSANDSDLQARRFERLGSALDAAALSLKRFQTSADAIETLAQGQVGTTAISGVSEQATLGGIDTQGVKNTTSFARSSLGSVGSGIVEEYTKTIEEIDRVKRELPALLTKASKGSNFSEDNIIGDVSKAFDGFSPDIQKKLETKLNSMDAKTVTQDLTTNPEKFAQTLTDPFKEAESVWQGIIKQLEDAPQKFAGDLGRASLLQNQAGATRDRSAEAGLGVVQAQTQLANARTGQNNQVSLNDLNQPFNSRQRRLASTAANPFDSDSITTQLRKTQNNALEQGGRANDVNLSGGDRKQAQIEFTRLTNESANLQKALEHLGDTSGRLSAIQTKIAEAEKVRSSQLSLTERLLTGDTSSRIDFHRGVAGADVAGQQGNFAGFSPENIKLTLDALRAFGDIKFTQGPLKGFTGSGAAEKLLSNTSGGFDPLINANATQRQIVGLHGNVLGVQQEGLKATQAQGSIQDSLAREFFKKINDGFDKFFQDADKRLAQADVKDKQTDVDRATAGLAQRSSQLATASTLDNTYGGLNKARQLSTSPDLKELAQGQDDLQRLTKIRGVGGSFDVANHELQKSNTIFGQDFTPQNKINDFTDSSQREEFLKNEQTRVVRMQPQLAADSGLTTQEVETAVINYLGKLREHVETGLPNGDSFNSNTSLLNSLKGSSQTSQQNALDTVNAKSIGLSQSVYNNTSPQSVGFVRKAAANQFDLGENLKNITDVKSVDSAQKAFDSQNDKLAASNIALIKANNQLTQVLEKAGTSETAVVHKATGGSIFKPKGSDTVPAMLTPGEFVVKAGQAKANRQALHQINNGSGPVYKADGGSIDNLAYWKKIEQDQIASEQARTAKNDVDFKQLTKGYSFATSAPRTAPKIDLKQHVANYDKRHAETLADNQNAFKTHIANYDNDHDVNVGTSEFALEAAKVSDAKRVATNLKSQASREGSGIFGPSDVAVARASKERVRRYTKSPKFVGPRQVARPIPDLENIGLGSEVAPPPVARSQPRRYRQDYTPRALPVPASEQVRRSRRKYQATDSFSVDDNRQVGNQIDAYLSQYLMGFAGGGMVPRGTDTVPAMLTRGEYVVDRQTASANLPLLQRLKPEYRASGGSIGNGQTTESGAAPSQSDQVLVALPTKLNASFSLLSKAIEPLAELPKSFTEFGRSQKELGTSLDAWATSAASLSQSLVPFVDSAAKLAQAINNSAIPSEIKVTTNNKVEVLINGAQVLASIKGDLGEVVMQAVMAKLPSAVKAIISEMPG